MTIHPRGCIIAAILGWTYYLHSIEEGSKGTAAHRHALLARRLSDFNDNDFVRLLNHKSERKEGLSCRLISLA